MSQPIINNVNTVPILPQATSTILAYPLAKVRSGIGIQEYINYKNDWNFFNTVWSYNYTISTLNGSGKHYMYYQFMSNGDQVSYSNGQMAHAAFYSDNMSQFNNIF